MLYGIRQCNMGCMCSSNPKDNECAMFCACHCQHGTDVELTYHYQNLLSYVNEDGKMVKDHPTIIPLPEHELPVRKDPVGQEELPDCIPRGFKSELCVFWVPPSGNGVVCRHLCRQHTNLRGGGVPSLPFQPATSSTSCCSMSQPAASRSWSAAWVCLRGTSSGQRGIITPAKRPSSRC